MTAVCYNPGCLVCATVSAAGAVLLSADTIQMSFSSQTLIDGAGSKVGVVPNAFRNGSTCFVPHCTVSFKR